MFPSDRPLKLRLGADGRISSAAPRDRGPLIVRAGTALAQLNRLAGAAGARPVDVQPVVQVADASSYPSWRAAREATWRAQGGAFSTASWPDTLAPGGLAAVLLPLPFGKADGRGARTAAVVASPLFASRADGSDPEDIALGLLGEWLRQAASGPTLRLTAPILETSSERRVLDCGLKWPLGHDG
jgi:hypothetical protein